MAVGIGPIEIVILLATGGAFLYGVSTLFRRRGPGSGGDNPLHPHLQKCPGCGASIPQNSDFCGKCGLRIAN